MNLYLYFAAPAIPSYQLPGPVREQGKARIAAFRNSGAPIPVQEKEIRQMIRRLHEDESSSRHVLEEADRSSRALRDQYHGLWKDLSDFFLFVPLWIGIYECLFGVVLEQGSFHALMDFGLSSLMQAVFAWLIVKGLVEGLVRDRSGWRRWLLFGGLFVLYLFLMKAASILPGSVQIPAFSVILASGAVFLLALMWTRAQFSPEQKIRPVS